MFPPGGGQRERHIQIIQPNEMTSIIMGVKVTTQQVDGLHRARVHCVDVATRELVYAWLFDIETEKPLVQRAYRIEVLAGRHTPYKFQYVNPLSEFAMLTFVSSQPSLLELRREKQGFEANESRLIELFIPPQSKAGNTA